MISKLKIKSIRVEKSIFESNPNFPGIENNKDNDNELSFNVEILINKSDNSIGMIRLGCEINVEKIEESPFFMNVNILGEFSADEEKFEDFVINAISLLFPYLRAHISTVTSISGVDPVIIPAINIIELLKENESGNKEE